MSSDPNVVFYLQSGDDRPALPVWRTARDAPTSILLQCSPHNHLQLFVQRRKDHENPSVLFTVATIDLEDVPAMVAVRRYNSSPLPGGGFQRIEPVDENGNPQWTTNYDAVEWAINWAIVDRIEHG